MSGLGEALALIALFFAWFLVWQQRRDNSQPITLRYPREMPPCDYCGAVDQTGVYFNGQYLDYLCDRCHREAEQAQVRA